MTDPVAEKSGFLKMYMSNHPDTLVAYAKWFGKVKEVITSAEMSAIDCKSMTLTCTLKDGSKKEVIVPIEPPMTGYEDVKPRLLEMKAFAQEGLGMIKAPKITTFVFPKEAWYSAVFILSLCTPYLFQGWPFPLGTVADYAVSWIGTGGAAGLFYSVQILHVFESLYTASLCRRHTGLALGATYIVATQLAGFPVWSTLRKNIQTARIDSVMKIQ